MHTTITIDINGHPHDLHHRTLTGAQIKALGHHEHGNADRVCTMLMVSREALGYRLKDLGLS